MFRSKLIVSNHAIRREKPASKGRHNWSGSHRTLFLNRPRLLLAYLVTPLVCQVVFRNFVQFLRHSIACPNRFGKANLSLIFLPRLLIRLVATENFNRFGCTEEIDGINWGVTPFPGRS